MRRSIRFMEMFSTRLTRDLNDLGHVRALTAFAY